MTERLTIAEKRIAWVVFNFVAEAGKAAEKVIATPYKVFFLAKTNSVLTPDEIESCRAVAINTLR